MKIEKAVCPHCGANLKIRPGQKAVECEYCGSTLLISGTDDTRTDAAGAAAAGTEYAADAAEEPEWTAVEPRSEAVYPSPSPVKRGLFPPPGFRSGNIVHMITAVIGYLGILYLIHDFGGPLEGVFLLTASLSAVDICTDWTGLYRRLTGVRNENPVVRIVMKAVWSLLIFLGWIVVMVLLELMLDL